MGGNAFPNVGAIAKAEIEPTLDKIYDDLKIPYNTLILGSVGKKPFSGDIDIAVDVPDVDQPEFIKQLRAYFGHNNVKKIGQVCSTFTDIQGYDSSLETDRKRTGVIQVDFIFGSLEWLGFFYHAPSDSKLKGVHRNIAISTLCGFTDREADSYLDGYDRPIYLKRWKWSPKDGLIQVERRSRRHFDDGHWLKKQDETMLSESFWTVDDFVRILFKDKLDASYFDSCETVVEAIKILYEPEYCEEIFAQMAVDMYRNHNIGGVTTWDYPDEIDKYIKTLQD